MHQLISKKNKVIIYIIFLLILSTTITKFPKIQKNYSSKINKINIKGLSHIKKSKIMVELNSLSYENILTIKKEEIKKVINRYNIIEEYSIKKIYPSTIEIKIKPTKYIARIYVDNQLLVGANGKVIEDKNNKEILPYIFGKFTSKDFLFFKKNIELSKFTFDEFKTLYFFPSNRWDILTNDNILIKLPQYNFLESINLAYKLINSSELKNANSIDLRLNNYLITK